MEILTLNAISDRIYEALGGDYHVSNDATDPDAILVRSFDMHGYEIGSHLLAVGRAGAGVNNIPLPEMTERGVVVFNTPGANANAVKELVLCGLLLASRDVIGGVNWTNGLSGQDGVPKLVEKGKKKFAGREILGKTLGVIGLGAIGGKVAGAALALGMQVVGYDPALSPAAKAALSPEVKIASFDEVLASADYLTLHVPLLDSTRNMIDAGAIAKMKQDAAILNFSRAELADVSAIKAGLASGKLSRYVVDFPTQDVLDVPGVIAIPHLGASTEEAEANCAYMAAKQLKDYLEQGTIVNSVNFPRLVKPRTNAYRIAVIGNAGMKEGVEGALAPLSPDVAYAERGTIAYLLADAAVPFAEAENGALLDALSRLDGVIGVRLL